LHEVAVIDREHFEGNHVQIEGTISNAERDRFESMLEEIEPV
jgi:GTPase